LKLSPFYERIVPRQKTGASPIRETNHFGVQLQAYYF